MVPLIALIVSWEVRKETIYLYFACDEDEKLNDSLRELKSDDKEKILNKHDNIIKGSYKRIKIPGFFEST